MFTPVPMLKISLQLLRDDAAFAALVLAESGAFNPELMDDPEKQLPELPAERYRKLHHRASSRLGKIKWHRSCALPEPGKGARVVPLEELEQLTDRLGELWQRFSSLEEEHHQLSDRGQYLQHLGESLRTFATLDVDLSLFQQTKGFLSLHLGTINRENLGRMEKAATLSGHLVKPFNQVENTTYVVVAGPAEADQGIAPLLKTADFRPIKIPPEFSDYPDKVKHELRRRTLELKRKLAEKRGEIEALERLHRMELDQACLTLKMTEPYASLADLLQGHGSLAAVEGWIPSDQAHGLAQALEKRLSRPFVLHMREPLDEERTQVPSLMRHSRLLRAFTALVKNYGIPRYGEIDPTLLFTITFILMFGMMFGDVGHGAIFILTGILLRKRFPGSMPFMAGAGLSSMAFGGLYGSIFGFEELFHPLWMAPLSNPMLMLEVALYWGIGFILIMNLLTGINLAAEGRWSQAILDNRGLAGMLLYAGGIYSGFRWLGEGIFGTPEALALLIPMAVILTYKWRRQDSPLGERVLVVAIEGFESMMNYLANTLSFLRVAAFSLNHVALAVAVFTMAEMMGTLGHWLTIVLGNLFIIVLEGAIVTIQVLRLEYYEGFSRFFSGDGREFKPLRYELR